MMRRVLLNHARDKHRLKRGAGAPVLPLSAVVEQAEETSFEILALDDALQRLAQIYPRQAQIIELRFFGGLSIEETAEFLGVTSSTVNRDWNLAKSWLARELGGSDDVS